MCYMVRFADVKAFLNPESQYCELPSVAGCLLLHLDVVFTRVCVCVCVCVCVPGWALRPADLIRLAS